MLPIPAPSTDPTRPQGEPVCRENFFEKGLACIQANNSAYAATVNTPEHSAWARYFTDHLGWTPTFLQLETMTTPAQWPQWFDPDYHAREAAE